jgi:glycosyltransferase involved in cell wall biosynthesis
VRGALPPQLRPDAALAAGFDVARGRVIVTLDGDLQNDPADIPRWCASSSAATTSSPAGARSGATAFVLRRLPSLAPTA